MRGGPILAAPKTPTTARIGWISPVRSGSGSGTSGAVIGTPPGPRAAGGRDDAARPVGPSRAVQGADLNRLKNHVYDPTVRVGEMEGKVCTFACTPDTVP